MLIYFESTIGCGIRRAKNIRAGRAAILKEVGTYNGIQVIREATENDIDWVSAMGGHVPIPIRDLIGEEK